jgi:hypothetical protein
MSSAKAFNAERSADSLSKISADAGTIMSIKSVLRNAFDSIRDCLDTDSNVTKESDSHSAKHSTPKKIQPMQEQSFIPNQFY